MKHILEIFLVVMISCNRQASVVTDETFCTHKVMLDDQTIEDNARFFDSIDDVPKSAISMGVKTIMQSRGIVLLASGQEKGMAIKKMLSGNITPELPASVLQLHPNATAIIDLEAASYLDLDTLRDQYQIVTPSKS
jgi:glucosamine-6-phosphate deaminase